MLVPEPDNSVAETCEAAIVVPVKFSVNIPPVKGKNKDNTEDKDVPFLYISKQLILFNTSKYLGFVTPIPIFPEV